jgi:uncharacterized peroxidase-related enzyme
MLAAVKAKLGMVPNLFKTLAHSPAALQYYLSASEALASTSISGALREQIALATAGQNDCNYCASAHTLMGKGAGIAATELAANLRGQSDDAKTQAALTFATTIVAERGRVSDADLAHVRAAGYSDAEITEIVATVAANIFTNYFNHIADTVVDFPLVRATALVAA